MMQKLRGSCATSISASSRLGWLATMIRPRSSANARKAWASMRSSPEARAAAQKMR